MSKTEKHPLYIKLPLFFTERFRKKESFTFISIGSILTENSPS